MSDIGDKIKVALAMVQGFLDQKTADDDFDDSELEQTIGELEEVITALQYELEVRQEARHVAGQSTNDQRVEI